MMNLNYQHMKNLKESLCYDILIRILPFLADKLK